MAQHPRFEQFKAAWQAGDDAQALAHIDAVVAEHPQVAALHWYRANCLLNLERFAQAQAAVARVLALRPDHAAALVKQVELDCIVEQIDAAAQPEPTPAQYAALERRAQERRQRHVAQLRKALALDPHLADACFGLSELLRPGLSEVAAEEHEKADARADEEADALLKRAIQLDPGRIQFRLVSAQRHRIRALDVTQTTPPEACVVSYGGMRYLRAELEAVLHEYEMCLRLSGDLRYRTRIGHTLHELGRFDEALAQYDLVLQQLPPDSPLREAVLYQRRRSEDQGAGERHGMAELMQSLVAKGDRSQADELMATMLLGAARAVSKGKSLEEAMAAHAPESPDDQLAVNIATQILNAAHEAEPGLVAVDSADFPAYQRKYAARQRRLLEAAGQRHIADAEAAGMTLTLGRRVLIGVYSDAGADATTATFALQPHWPGLPGFVILFLTGKWKTHYLTESISYFDDGGYLITQYENISPFTYGDVIDIERLPRSTSVAALIARHAQRVAAYQQAHPQARPLKADDLAAVEANWRHGQAIKRAYRRSVGYATDSELRGMLGGNYARLADKVRRKLQELAPDYEEDAGLV